MKDIEPILKLVNEIIEDRTVPKNIRSAVEEARKNLTENDGRDWDVRVSTAISILDEITNDPNIPNYTRIQVWNIVTMLETVKN